MNDEGTPDVSSQGFTSGVRSRADSLTRSNPYSLNTTSSFSTPSNPVMASVPFGEVRLSPQIQSQVAVGLSQVLSRRQADCLAFAFIRYYHTLVPMIHVPSFLEAYNNYFWTSVGDPAQAGSSSAIIALIHAVLFGGAAVCPIDKLNENFPGRERVEVSTMLHEHAEKALRLTRFPQSPSIESLTAFLVIQSVWTRCECGLPVAPLTDDANDNSRGPNGM